MIFYYKSNNDFNIQVKDLLKNLDEQLDIHTAKQKVLLKCLENINTILQNKSENTETKKFYTLSEEMKSAQEKLIQNISDLESLKSFLAESTLELPNKFNYKNKKLMGIVKQYNKLAIECKNNIYSNSLNLDKLMLEYSENFIPVINTYLNKIAEEEQNFFSNAPSSKIENENNNVLLISEVQNKVILPYSLLEVEKKLNNSQKYTSIQDVIDHEYTFPLSDYKNPRISRFKEAFNLMRKKEKSSMVDSLDLALELSFNNLLNPAIIAACKNLDELDVYLDCLTSNELDKFKFFKIKYEIFPKIQK